VEAKDRSLMGKMSVHINDGDMIRAMAQIKKGYKAMIDTIDDPGHVRILTSRRKMTQTEREHRRDMRRAAKAADNPALKPGPHIQGWNIANFLRTAGNDPFDYTESVWNQVNEELVGDIQEAIFIAYQTEKDQVKLVKRALMKAGGRLVKDVKERIRKGELGKNARGYMFNKLKMYDKGKTDKKYGRPPPYGIFSGRFYEGIRFAYFSGASGRISGSSGAVR
jgi:hypothetical protein